MQNTAQKVANLLERMQDMLAAAEERAAAANEHAAALRSDILILRASLPILEKYLPAPSLSPTSEEEEERLRINRINNYVGADAGKPGHDWSRLDDVTGRAISPEEQLRIERMNASRDYPYVEKDSTDDPGQKTAPLNDCPFCISKCWDAVSVLREDGTHELTCQISRHLAATYEQARNRP